MGSELVGSSSSQIEKNGSREVSTPFNSFTEVFEKYFPFYLSLGMTYAQYWEDDCNLTRYYLEAYKLKQERETNYDNYKLWLQGFYFYEALCDVSPVLHAFAKQGTKVIPYRKQPLPLTKEQVEEQEQIERNKRLLGLKYRLMNSVKK